MEPKDLTFLKELAIKPTLEEELNIEKRVLEIKATHDMEDLRKYAIGLQRQNMHQTYFIANCLEQIAKLQGRLVAQEYPAKEPSCIQKIFKSWGWN